MILKIEVTEFVGGLGWDGGEHIEIIDEERFKELYGEYLLKSLLEKGHTGDCIGGHRGMRAKLLYSEDCLTLQKCPEECSC